MSSVQERKKWMNVVEICCWMLVVDLRKLCQTRSLLHAIYLDIKVVSLMLVSAHDFSWSWASLSRLKGFARFWAMTVARSTRLLSALCFSIAHREFSLVPEKKLRLKLSSAFAIRECPKPLGSPGPYQKFHFPSSVSDYLRHIQLGWQTLSCTEW